MDFESYYYSSSYTLLFPEVIGDMAKFFGFDSENSAGTPNSQTRARNDSSQNNISRGSTRASTSTGRTTSTGRSGGSTGSSY